MISTLELQQFRGLEHVKFENLGRVNLIIGGNNTGKTSILESLVLLYGDEHQLGDLPNTFREPTLSDNNSVSEFWMQLLRNEDFTQTFAKSNDQSISVGKKNGVLTFIKPISHDSTGGAAIIFNNDGVVEINYGRNLPKLSVLTTRQAAPTDVSELFNYIAPLNPEKESKLEDLLRKSIEPRLRRLRYAKPKGSKTHLIYADIGEGKMLPFTQMGQAFARTLQVYCEIFAQRPKMLLIDEIENGLYYEGMEDYWKGLMAVLEDQDVQLFATTHSRECMEAAYRAAKDMPNDPLRYLRLDRRIDDPAKIVATTFGKEEMATAIEFNREMR